MPQFRRRLCEPTKLLNICQNLKGLRKYKDASFSTDEKLQRERSALIKRRLDLLAEKRQLEAKITDLTRNLHQREFKNVVERRRRERKQKTESQAGKEMESESELLP